MARTILDIVIACKDQQPATEEELRLTVVALSHMLRIVETSERKLSESIAKGAVHRSQMLAGFASREAERRFQARKTPPAEYLGPSFTPGTPENAALAKQARAVFEKATGEKL